MGGLNRHVNLQISGNVVAGPRACQSNQSNHGQPQGVDPTKEWKPQFLNLHKKVK